MRKLLAILGLLCSAGLAFGQAAVQQSGVRIDASTNIGFNQAAAGSPSSVTITPPAGQYAYITGIGLDACVNNTATAVQTNLNFTTAGIIGNPSWSWSSPGTVNTCANAGSGAPFGYGDPPTASVVTEKFATPLRSAFAGGTTAVSFTSPTTTNVQYTVRVYYYFAP